jgi:hypothetical protein
MASERPTISVIVPIQPAIEAVKIILFTPFDLGRWFIIGFGAWLAYLGRGSLPPSFGFPFPGSRGGLDTTGIPQDIRAVFGARLPLIIVLASIGFVAGIAIAVVCLWLSSRGRFMFLHCVVKNTAEVKVPWQRFRREGNSLFLFRLAVAAVFFVGLTLFVVPILILAGLIDRSGIHLGIPGAWVLVCLLLILLPAAVVSLIIVQKFTADFVVPIMYLRGHTCIEAWREFWGLLSGNIGRFALYILFQIVIALAIGVIVSTAVIMTCCCAGIVLAIPYIGTVLMLPLLVFSRAYSLYYLGQYGLGLDVFRQESEAHPVVGSG